MEALGKEIVPVETVRPFPAITLPAALKFPFKEESPLINTLPPKEASEPTNSRLFIDASPVINKRPFNDKSSAIITS